MGISSLDKGKISHSTFDQECGNVVLRHLLRKCEILYRLQFQTLEDFKSIMGSDLDSN